MSLPDLQDPLALLEEKNYDEAIDVLEHKVTALPAHLGAHVLLAYAYEGCEQWDHALEAWEEVHFLLPNSPIAAAGKQRVLRRMDGIEVDAEAPRPTEAPRPSAAAPPSSPEDDEKTDAEEHDPTEPDLGEEKALKDRSEATAEQSEGTADANENALEETAPEAKGINEEENEPADDPSPTDQNDGLAQLRRQAEREARQGGARPGLSDAPPSGDPSATPNDSSSTPEEQVEQFEEEESSDDLDRLIDKLQSARIDPDPDAEAEAPPENPTPQDDTEEVVSETLARIHEGQGDYEKAARIYATLADQEPHQAEQFREKAAEMREKADAENDSA